MCVDTLGAVDACYICSTLYANTHVQGFCGSTKMVDPPQNFFFFLPVGTSLQHYM